jgi:hypothetical protein
LESEDIAKILPLLKQRFPELNDSKRMLGFLEARGLTFKEIHATIDILQAEQQKAKDIS